MCLRYEDHFGTDLAQLRQQWRIIVAPQPPPHLAPKKRDQAGHLERQTGR
jgi:hypothetical protein